MSTTYFTNDHEWLRVEGDIATVGITNHAQEQLGDIVFVELPDVGTVLEQEGSCVVVESVKAASDVYAPVSGEVTEVNNALEDNPALVNSAAMGEGWLWKMRLDSPDQLEGLMDDAAYNAMIA